MATYVRKRNGKKTSVKEEAQRAIEKLQAPNESLAKKDADTVVNEDGTVTVNFSNEEPEDLGSLSSVYSEEGHFSNLASLLDEDENLALASIVVQNVDNDDNSRSEWLNTITFGFDLLGVKVEEKNTPFEGACSAQHPLLMESAVKFQSKASNELLPANGPVKTKVLGEVTVEKEAQANRVKNHLNYQVTEEMTEFYPDTERLLLYLSLVGDGFKKNYYNSHLERPCSEFVPADLFIVPNSSPDLHRAIRYTHVLYKTQEQLDADCAAGLYHKPEGWMGSPSEAKFSDVQKKTQKLTGIEVSLGERDKVYTLYEQHIEMYIEAIAEDNKNDPRTNGKDYKLASPYIITVDSGSNTVIGLRRNWKEGDVKRKKIVQFTHYQFVPSFNFYSYGFLHLLGNLQLSLTSALRSLVDAGQFATLQGGFKLKGVRIADDGSPIYPGQFKELETVVMDINKAIMPLPFKEPSTVLYQMLEFLDRKGQKFADSTEQVIADATNYGPVGTTMALLDASTKFFSAIHKRLHNSLKQDLQAIAAINADTLDEDGLVYNIENETMKINRQDYDDRIDIIPVSDPNISSSAHRMAKAQTLYEFAMRAPELHDMREVLKHVYVNMDYENIDKILPTPQEAQPNDPVTDIQLAVQGKPIKAFPGQDHKAHVAIKQAFMQDPMSGANPIMQKASVQIQANVQEHMMLNFVEQMQAQGQMDGADQGAAAQKVAMMNQQHLQQELDKNAQTSKDKVAMMLAQAELMDTQTQQRKQAFDEQYKVAALELQKEKLDMEKVKEINRADEKRLEMTSEISKVVTTTGLDAMIQGMSQGFEAKQRQKEMDHEKEMAKSQNKDKPKPAK